MIEFKKIQIIEKIKPATVSFLLNYTDGKLHELTEEFKLKLKNMLHIEMMGVNQKFSPKKQIQ